MRKKEEKAVMRKKAIGCGAFMLLAAGMVLGTAVKFGGLHGRNIGEEASILTPVWEDAEELMQEGEVFVKIADDKVPLSAGPGMLGAEGADVSEYAQPAVQESPYIRQVVRLVNEERAKEGLPPLEKADDISSAAAVRARELTASFSHTRPDGSAYRTVLEQNGICFRSCGENVAYGYATPEAVMSAWMTSEGHRANILNEGYTDIGVGYFTDGGRGYWVQVFTMKK